MIFKSLNRPPFYFIPSRNVNLQPHNCNSLINHLPVPNQFPTTYHKQFLTSPALIPHHFLINSSPDPCQFLTNPFIISPKWTLNSLPIPPHPFNNHTICLPVDMKFFRKHQKQTSAISSSLVSASSSSAFLFSRTNLLTLPSLAAIWYFS